MEETIYQNNSKYDDIIKFIKEIEEISKRKIINCIEEAEKIEADIIVIAPCSRSLYKKTCKFYI